MSFSLQYKGQFVGNFVRGGKLALYMCRTTNVYNNTFTDSTTNGIYVSFPSDNISIIGNKIYNTTYSGIVMKNQIEHGTFTPYIYNIIVQLNTIFNSHMYGIELNNANTVIIKNNKIVSGQTMGIYSYNGKNLLMTLNNISYFNYGIYLEQTSNSNIQSNTLNSIFNSNGSNAIKIFNSSSDTVVSNNICGQYTSTLISDGGTNDNISSNNINSYYTLNQERNIYTVI